MTTTTPTPTTAAQALALAAELREHRDAALMKLDAFKKFNDYAYDNALTIATTLDALAAENAKLREENAKAMALIERMNRHGDEIQSAIEGLKGQLIDVIRGHAPQEPVA